MKNYDYHRPAEKVLLDSYRKQNRNKNRLLFLAVVLTVGVIFCMISFAYGKIQVEIQKHIRTDGMTVSTYLENGTEEMAGQLHMLSYIAETGKEKFAGKLCNQTIKYCDCVVADETAFETMLCPAYTQIVGTYPKQENEIMLSVKTLKYLGISEPKVGMELNLDFYWNDLFQTKGTGQQTFRLSGYFTEYQNQGASSSIAFLSEKKLKESGAGWEPCRILLKPEKDSVSGMQMEQQLQEDIRLKEGQRIVSMDSAAYRAVEGMLGSYGFAALFSFLVLLCMFLFIYNILNLSLGIDLQQYGLMEVIGVQQHQIIQMLFRQMLEVVLKGSLAGVAIGSLVVLGVLPSVIGKLYLGQTEELEGISFYQPMFFLIAILPVAVTLGVVILLVKQKIKILSPLECMNYGTGTVAEKKQTKKKKAVFQSFGNKPEVSLARRYLFYNKRFFFITMISLTIGCGLALGSSVIIKGVDLQNQFMKEPDFQIRITQEACRTLMETSPDTENMVFFPKEFLANIKQTAGNNLQDETKIQGFYPIIGKQGRDSIKLLNDGETVPTVIQKISFSEKEKLQEFLKEQEITTDWETFAHENGTILLHDHRVSEYAEERALEQIGNIIEVYDLVPVGTDMSDLLPETLVNCGYLDITKDGFPELELCWDGRNTNLLLVTEETFETLSENLTPQTFEMSFSVEKEQESGCKNRLKGMIQTENMEFQSENGYTEKLNLFQMESRSDLLLNLCTQMITVLFEKGEIEILIGTKSLLGEGWDSPCINALIMASSVGSYVLGNQMRGRTIRASKDNPDKTSNIWHLVCMTDTKESCEVTEDFRTLQRRMMGFLGVSYDGTVIENGMERLNTITPPYTYRHLMEINEDMKLRACMREELKAQWQQAVHIQGNMEAVETCKMKKKLLNPGASFFNALGMIALSVAIRGSQGMIRGAFRRGYGQQGITDFIFTVAAAGIFLWGVWRLVHFSSPLKRLREMAEGMKAALAESQNITSSCKISVYAVNGVDYQVFLKGGTTREKELFAQCMEEFLAAVDNQRYLLYAPKALGAMTKYYCVPSVFSKTKQDALFFQKVMSSHLGKYHLVYTRTPQGRAVLLKGRAEAFGSRNERLFNRKKEIKGALE